MPKEKVAPKEKKVKTVKAVKASVKENKDFSVPAYTLTGEESGSLSLPEEIFGADVNKALLSQAVRVYMNNLNSHYANTKTRGEVRGSTRKVRAQKGTGGARHGGIRAPIFVGGGIALGPKFRKVVLDLPKKMKTAALISALSSKFKESEVIGVIGTEKASGKTREAQPLIKKLAKKNLLLILDKKEDKLQQAVRNLPKIEVVDADQLNILEILHAGTLMLTQEAVVKLQARMSQKGIGNK